MLSSCLNTRRLYKTETVLGFAKLLSNCSSGSSAATKMSVLRLEVFVVICLFISHLGTQGLLLNNSHRSESHTNVTPESQVNLASNTEVDRSSVLPIDPNANGSMNSIVESGSPSNRNSNLTGIPLVADMNPSETAWPFFLLRYIEIDTDIDHDNEHILYAENYDTYLYSEEGIDDPHPLRYTESDYDPPRRGIKQYMHEIDVSKSESTGIATRKTLLESYASEPLRLASAKKTNTICYETSRAPFYDCGGKFESFPYFKVDYTSVGTTMKLELCPTGKRLLYLNQMDGGGLEMSFLHPHHTDHLRILPGLKFIDFSFDWVHGVLFTLNKHSKLEVWTMASKKEPQMQAQFQVALGTRYRTMPALTCNQRMEKFYILNSNGSIDQIDYSPSRGRQRFVLEAFVTDGLCWGPVHWRFRFWFPRFRPSLVSYENNIYCISWPLRELSQKLVRIDAITGESTNVPLPAEHDEIGSYTQLAVNQVDDELISEIEKTCSGCQHRCIPVYNQSAKCACPFEQLGFHVNTPDWNTKSNGENSCVSKEVQMVQLINIPGSGNHLQHMELNPDESPVGRTNASSDFSFVPVWNFGLPPFFCSKRLRTYTCHSYHQQKKALYKFDAIYNMAVKTVSRTNADEWIVIWKKPRCIQYQMFNSSTPDLANEKFYTLYCHYELMDSGHYQARRMPDNMAIDGQSYTIVFSDKQKLCVVKPGGERGIEKLLRGKLEEHKPLAIRNDLVLHMSADNKSLITTYVEGPPQSFQFSMENSKIMPSEFQATWMSPTTSCWIEKDQLIGRYIKCVSWDTTEVQVFMPPSNASLVSFAVSYSNSGFTSAHPCYNGNNTCSHLCVPKGDVSVKQYTCLCPDELPVNLDGLCTIRLRMIAGVGSETQTVIFNDGGVTNTTRVGFMNISFLEHANMEMYDAGTKRICYVVASDSNIRCASSTDGHPSSVIAGSHGARFLVGSFMQVFSNEMYWSSVEPTEADSPPYRQCFHLGSMASDKPSMRLKCLNVDKIIPDRHITLDPQRKTLFYFEAVKGDVSVRAVSLTAGAKSDGVSVPISAHSAFRKLNSFEMELLKPKIIAYDDTVKKVYTVTVDQSESEYNIHFIRYNTQPSISLDIPEQYLTFGKDHKIWALVSFRGYLFWYNSVNRLWGKRPNSPRPFKVANYSATPLLSMVPTYTPEELKVQSPCFGTRCEFYCHVVETGIKPVAQCLCNDTDGGYRFCDPLRDPVSVEQEQGSDWALPTGISIGVFLLLAVFANIGGCIYLRKRNKAEMDRIIEGFMEGDTDRASAARNEAEKAEFLPFTAIINHEDLALNQTKILGEGNFGTVYEGLFDRKVVAVKTVKSNLDPQVIEDFLRELKITAYVGDHEQIVRFYGAEISRIHNGRVLVVLELCPNGDLLSYIRKYTEWDWCDFEESVDISEPKTQGHLETTRYAKLPSTSTTIPNPGYEVLIASADQTENLDSASMSVEPDFVIDLSKLFEEIESAADVLPVPTPAARRAAEVQKPNYSNIEPLTKVSTPALVTKETTIVRLPKECVVWAHQIAIGMEYLERKKVIHGDLAARNILVFDNKVVKISDFGFSRNVYQYQTYQKKTACPLPFRWCSPETLSRLEFSSKADVWSYAVTVWEMFAFGNVPFANLVWDVAFVDRIVEQGMRLEKPHSMPQKLYDEIMAVCWQVDPAQRPNFTQLRDMFESVLNSM